MHDFDRYVARSTGTKISKFFTEMEKETHTRTNHCVLDSEMDRGDNSLSSKYFTFLQIIIFKYSNEYFSII